MYLAFLLSDTWPHFVASGAPVNARRICITLLSLLSLLIASGVAHADARYDIFRMRHDEMPLEHQMLGWTSDNEAVFRNAVCGSGGTNVCNVSIDIIAPSSTSSIPLLNFSGDDPIETSQAMHFIRAEREALALLPLLEDGRHLDVPEEALGTVLGETLHLDTASRPVADDEEALSLVVRADKRGVKLRVAEVRRSWVSLFEVEIRDAYLSPDASRLALVIHSNTAACWDFEMFHVVVIDLGDVRAKVANTAGFRAYKRGDMRLAYDGFVEATRHNPAHGLAWFNRAGIESLAGDVGEAARSLGRAVEIDGSFVERACGDRDFVRLSQTREGERLLGGCVPGR